MKISLVLTPCSETNLRLARQVGVTDVVGRYPGVSLDDMLRLKDRVQAHELKLSVIEGYVPQDLIVHGRSGREDQIENICLLIRNMARAGVPLFCYHFMPDADWSRTAVDTPERGGARVTSFNLVDVGGREGDQPSTPAPALWENLSYFLNKVLPVAEHHGIKLALHPDDPPVPQLKGQDRILGNIDAFDRVLEMSESTHHGICFCQGTFSQAGIDIPQAIRHFGHRIHYVHFRNVVGTVPSFRESFHDNGQIDMYEAVRAYHEIGFRGPIRPDHVPVLAGEAALESVEISLPPLPEINASTFNSESGLPSPGYTMLGRLYAVGYMKGLIEAVEKQSLSDR